MFRYRVRKSGVLGLFKTVHKCTKHVVDKPDPIEVLLQKTAGRSVPSQDRLSHWGIDNDPRIDRDLPLKIIGPNEGRSEHIFLLGDDFAAANASPKQQRVVSHPVILDKRKMN